VNRLRNRLILVFLLATVVPLGVTLWITTQVFRDATARLDSREAEIDTLSRSLETTGRAFYLQACSVLKSASQRGEIQPTHLAESALSSWPSRYREFWQAGEKEAFVLVGARGDHLDYLVRGKGELLRYNSDLGGVEMQRLLEQFSNARKSVEYGRTYDLRRGFTYTYMLLAGAIWMAGIGVLTFLAHRISRPIQQLTAGLSKLASGDLSTRVPVNRDDEVGRAIQAFNDMAEQLRQSQERLVYLAQLASWQTLARKMAHEVKNSLTPIRLTVEEMVARHSGADRAFLEQAAQIVVDEVEGLERRVRAFSEFAAEPSVSAGPVLVNLVVEERITFLKSAHPETTYELRLSDEALLAQADEDLFKGILTNLLENAADAAGRGGTILTVTRRMDSRIAIEIHDSGPGLTDQAKRTLFQPTISFKKRGMGLGLSITKKSALLQGGDILYIPSELGGAGFRVILPQAQESTAPPERRIAIRSLV
jgi:nitrogen fixation/metabolism regulation signal transduction histidine kinase